MQVSVENTGGLERRLTVQVPGEEIQQKIDSKLRELSKQVRVKGFRPGRVPMSVVKQRYGKQVRFDIVNETMQASLQEAIREQDLRPASMPRLDGEPEDIEGGAVEFKALIEVYPEIGDIKVGEISMDKPEVAVSDDDVEEMLETLRKQRRVWEEVERKAEKGDQVVLDYSAEGPDGRVPEEGTSPMQIVMGESGFTKLESALIGLKAGDEKSVKLNFPEDFRNPSLAGQKATIDVKVNTVSSGDLPEVDEEFVKGFGVEDGELDSLKTEIRGNLERELKQAETSVIKARMIDELFKVTPDLEVPKSIVRDEASALARQMIQQPDQEPDPQLVEIFMDQAESRVRAGLLMGEIASQNDIQVDALKVRETIETLASTYEQSDEVVQLYYGNPNMLQQVESAVLEEQVVDWVLENAKVTPKAMTFQEVIAESAKNR